MTVSLITNDLKDQFNDLLANTNEQLLLVSPFIGLQTSKHLANWLNENKHVTCNIITRFYREEFIENVSSVYGLEKLLHAGANIYALLDLHSKLYVFDTHSSIIGSANFTHGGFVSNHEVSILLSDEELITTKCDEYFNDLLVRIIAAGGGVVTQEWIDEEKEAIRKTAPNRKDKTVAYSNFKRRGVELPKIAKDDLFEEIFKETPDIDSNGVWLKFEGTGEDRIPNKFNYQEMKGVRKRDLNQTFFPVQPSGIQMDDILFLTIVSNDEDDRPTSMIVGYAKTSGYIKENVASEGELLTTSWKKRFPYYVEFSDGMVIKAPIKNGIRLIDLYSGLGKLTYPSLKNKSNVSLKSIHSMHFRRSHIRITQEAKEYLMEELEKKFKKYGSITLG